MTRLQWIVLAGAASVFLLLYFGFDTRAFQNQEEMPGQEATEKVEDGKVEWNIRRYRNDAMDSLDSESADLVQAMEYRLEGAETDSARVEELKKLSGKWYDFGYLHLAGLYAERVAQIMPSDSAWSLAGTTYSLAMQNMSDPELVEFSAGRARHAFEQAISLSPDEVQHRVNLALTYTLRPRSDKPMKGVRMLLELNSENPGNVSVLNALGRLSLKTGQLDKAVQRLEQVLEIDSSNSKANCLLSTVYSKKGNFALAKEYRQRCSDLQSRR